MKNVFVALVVSLLLVSAGLAQAQTPSKSINFQYDFQPGVQSLDSIVMTAQAVNLVNVTVRKSAVISVVTVNTKVSDNSASILRTNVYYSSVDATGQKIPGFAFALSEILWPDNVPPTLTVKFNLPLNTVVDYVMVQTYSLQDSAASPYGPLSGAVYGNGK